MSTQAKDPTYRQPPRVGRRHPSRQRTSQRSRPDQRHHAGDGFDDRLGHLHRFRRDLPRSGFSRLADRRMAGHRIHDHRRRPQLRRTGGHDAACRRPIRLPARSAGAAVGLSIWLDAVPGDPDRNHRRRGRGLRQVSRRLLSLDFFLQLDTAHLEGSSDSTSAQWYWATWMLA